MRYQGTTQRREGLGRRHSLRLVQMWGSPRARTLLPWLLTLTVTVWEGEGEGEEEGERKEEEAT